MSNVNDYVFSKLLEWYKSEELDKLEKQVFDAERICSDANYQWKDDKQKAVGQEKLKMLRARLEALNHFYKAGRNLVGQHENLVNKMSKIYDNWYNNISNDGKQEVEMMRSQADLLCELMGELYKELLPLQLEGMRPPHGLNL